MLTRGERVTVHFPEDQPPRTLKPASIPLVVVYEDEHLAVIDKPAGLVVHPAPGHWDDTLVNALVARGTTLAGGAEGRPGVVHRLDRDTSGLMVVAKTDLAHRRLGAAIAARRVRRTYAALAWGHLDASPDRDRRADRAASDRSEADGGHTRGRPARTDAWVVARFGVVDLLRLELHTGRTHQIRVHLEHIGHPVVGDPTYAGGGSRRVSGPPEGGRGAGAGHAEAGASRGRSGIPPSPDRGADGIPGRMADGSAGFAPFGGGERSCCSP